MKNQKYIWLAIILIIGLAFWQFHKPTPVSPQPKPTATTPATTNLANPILVAAPTTNQNTSNVSPSPAPSAAVADIENRYRQGLISKDAAIQEVIMEGNKKSQDFYGKAIDQYGQPVSGVDVTGNLIFEQGVDSDEKIKVYKTQSDIEGLFQFTGLAGAQLGVTVSKEGYLMGARGEGYKTPASGKTSPDDRAILTMWKLRGPEPLVSSSIEAAVAHDGTPTIFDLATQKKSPDGDLQVTLSRSPLEVRRSGNKFDWTVKIKMLQGGLVAENDPYPYWAAESGYEPSFEFSMSSNNVPWHSTVTQNFYIRSSRGQYGRMQMNVYANLTPARIKFDFWVNPSGSQNLEPSPPNP